VRIVRESINFERYKDPLKSLKIGMKDQFDEFKKDHQFSKNTSHNWMLAQAILEERYDIINYILDVLKADVNGGNNYALMTAANIKDVEMCKFLIEKGANLKETIDLLDEEDTDRAKRISNFLKGI
jgi:ankyrin repeat protein